MPWAGPGRGFGDGYEPEDYRSVGARRALCSLSNPHKVMNELAGRPTASAVNLTRVWLNAVVSSLCLCMVALALGGCLGSNVDDRHGQASLNLGRVAPFGTTYRIANYRGTDLVQTKGGSLWWINDSGKTLKFHLDNAPVVKPGVYQVAPGDTLIRVLDINIDVDFFCYLVEWENVEAGTWEPVEGAPGCAGLDTVPKIIVQQSR